MYCLDYAGLESLSTPPIPCLSFSLTWIRQLADLFIWLCCCFLSVPPCLLKTTDFLSSGSLVPLSPQSWVTTGTFFALIHPCCHKMSELVAFAMGWPCRKPTCQVAPMTVKSAALCSFWDAKRWPGASCTWNGELQLDSWKPPSKLQQVGVALFLCPCFLSTLGFLCSYLSLPDQKIPRTGCLYTLQHARPHVRQSFYTVTHLDEKYPLFLRLIIFFLPPPVPISKPTTGTPPWTTETSHWVTVK